MHSSPALFFPLPSQHASMLGGLFGSSALHKAVKKADLSKVRELVQKNKVDEVDSVSTAHGESG